MHIGHLNAFEFCKEHCDHLILGIASDDYCNAKRSYDDSTTVTPRKMWNSYASRKRLLEAFRQVDEVYAYGHSCPYVLCMELREKGIEVEAAFLNPEYEGTELYNEAVEKLNAEGIKPIFVPRTKDVSSTEIKEIQSQRN